MRLLRLFFVILISSTGFSKLPLFRVINPSKKENNKELLHFLKLSSSGRNNRLQNSSSVISILARRKILTASLSEMLRAYRNLFKISLLVMNFVPLSAYLPFEKQAIGVDQCPTK